VATASDSKSETAGSALARLTQTFAAAGIDSASLDARLLTAAALGVAPDSLRLHPNAQLDGTVLSTLDHMAHQRATARMPVSRILGRREFWSLDFSLSAATLDPRPDSETLVETALGLLADRNQSRRLLDLGTGTGCLLLALLSELPAATGIGVDIDSGAIETASANAAALGLQTRAVFQVADWTAGLNERFDLIVSNPPYIPRAEIDALAPEVARHDPRGALDGGGDGLDAYRAIAPLLAPRLTENGVVVLEIGANQASAVASLLNTAGLQVAPPVADLAGRDRCLVCRVG
jgi:release factor glutamine methyltransferase